MKRPTIATRREKTRLDNFCRGRRPLLPQALVKLRIVGPNRKLQTSKAPLKSQAQGTSLFTSAASNQNSFQRIVRGKPNQCLCYMYEETNILLIFVKHTRVGVLFNSATINFARVQRQPESTS